MNSKNTMGFFGEDNGRIGRGPSGLGLYLAGIFIIFIGLFAFFSPHDKTDSLSIIALGIGIFLFGLWISRLPIND